MPADSSDPFRKGIETAPTGGWEPKAVYPSPPDDADMVSVPRWAAAKVHDHLPFEPVGKLGEAKALLYAAATSPSPAPSAPAETAEGAHGHVIVDIEHGFVRPGGVTDPNVESWIEAVGRECCTGEVRLPIERVEWNEDETPVVIVAASPAETPQTPSVEVGPLLAERLAWEADNPRPEQLRRVEKAIVVALRDAGFGTQHQLTGREFFEIAVDELVISVAVRDAARPASVHQEGEQHG